MPLKFTRLHAPYSDFYAIYRSLIKIKILIKIKMAVSTRRNQQTILILISINK